MVKLFSTLTVYQAVYKSKCLIFMEKLRRQLRINRAPIHIVQSKVTKSNRFKISPAVELRAIVEEIQQDFKGKNTINRVRKSHHLYIGLQSIYFIYKGVGGAGMAGIYSGSQFIWRSWVRGRFWSSGYKNRRFFKKKCFKNCRMFVGKLTHMTLGNCMNFIQTM